MKTKIAFLLLALITVLVYANSLSNDFIWDDTVVISDNDFVKSWKNFPRLFNRSYLSDSADIDQLGERDIGSGEFLYRPVSTVTLFIDYALWKSNPFGFHLTNLFLHLLNVLLIFFLVIQLARNRTAAFLTALFFAVHPVNAETVNIIAFRPNLLSFLFCAVSFILFIRFREYSGRKKIFAFSLSLVSFLLALFSKEMAISLPVIFLLYDVLIGKILRKKYYCGYVLVLAVYFFVKFVVMGNALRQQIVTPMQEFHVNLFTMAKVHLRYLLWLFFPLDVHPTLPDAPGLIARSLEPEVLVSIVFFAAIIVAIIRIRRKLPVISFAVAWTLITFLSVSNIFYPLTNYMSARYLYFASFGFCLTLGCLLSNIPVVLPSWDPVRAKRIMLEFVIIFTLFCFACTVIRSMGFKNDTVFWREMAQRYPNNAVAHSGLGAALKKSGPLENAIQAYQAALRLDPGYAKDHDALGVCYFEAGELDNAYAEFENAIKIDPALAVSYTHMGSVLGEKGLYREAIQYFNTALNLGKDRVNAYNGLGVTYARKGDYDLARQSWEKALQISPGNKEISENLKKLKDSGF